MKLIFQPILVVKRTYNAFFFKYIIHQDLHVFHKNNMEVIFVY